MKERTDPLIKMHRTPCPEKEQVLIEVHAASINPVAAKMATIALAPRNTGYPIPTTGETRRLEVFLGTYFYHGVIAVFTAAPTQSRKRSRGAARTEMHPPRLKHMKGLHNA